MSEKHKGNPRASTPQASKYPGQAAAYAPVKTAELKRIFLLGLESQAELMDLSHNFAASLVSGKSPVKHHQLRLLLDLAIRVKQSHKGNPDQELSPASRGRLAVMRPRLAYMAARERGLGPLQKELDLLLKEKEAFKTGADLDRLYEFVAAVVAYHRYEEANKSFN